MKKLVTILIVLSAFTASAQKVDSIYFNLYTDSLKKGVHNYINVDGKLTNGTYQPLMSNEVAFTSSAGRWEGNSLIVDSAYKQDSVVITASLKEHPEVKKNVTIYLKKIVTEPPLKTEKELLEEWRKKGQQKN
ncbi:MAG TPA: hypothetical protein VK369_12400 [Segetibacter sp.]|nr:hypothetical protein [Segetibacter sp.]